MGRSKVVFEREYDSNCRYYNLSSDPVIADFNEFLDSMRRISEKMHHKFEMIDGKFVEYWILGMDEGVVVYRMESRQGEICLSRAKATIWPNKDKQLPCLEAKVKSFLPYPIIVEDLEYDSTLFCF